MADGIDQKKCTGSKVIDANEKVFQTNREEAERALIERDRSPTIQDPDPKKPPKENPLYVEPVAKLFGAPLIAPLKSRQCI